MDRLLRQTEDYLPHFRNVFSEQVINNNASLFLGTGVSINSGYPGWAELLSPCAEELGIEISDESDLYAVAQYYANRHNDAELRRLISGKINKIAQSNPLLEELFSVGFHSIWTTNFDKLIEDGLARRFIPNNVIFSDKSLASIDKQDKITIYKMNGDISDPVNMILTKSDYERYQKRHPLFLTFLKKELVANTFLFVGYSFSDDLVLSLLSAINEFMGEAGNRHYAIMPVDERVGTRFECFVEDLDRRYNVKCLCVKKEDIPHTVCSLNYKVREKKVFISGAYDTVPEETNNYADTLSRTLVDRLLGAQYRIVTGVGKRLGTFITGYAHQYIAEHNIPNASKHLSMRPFPFHLALDIDTKDKYRTMMQRDCDAAIFLFGQSRSTAEEGSFEQTGHYSRGVYQEFEIAKRLGLAVIPVGSTGLESEVIWREVKANINLYPYLSKKIDVLHSERNPEHLSTLILSILRDISKYRSIQ